MAKLTAPLLSFGGAGQIGKTQVYSRWRGINYARRYVIPANPNSTSQQHTRSVFAWLNATWKLMNPAAQAVWLLFSKGRPFTDRNAWISHNLSGLRGTDSVPATTLAALVGSPGANGGLAAVSAVGSDGGTHHLVVTVTVPDLPDGWTHVASHAIAFKQQNANSDAFYTSYYGTDDSDPDVISIDLGGALTVEWTAWIEYTKPDGSTAYSPSITGSQVVA